MEDKPRYSRTSDILDLLVLMQSRVQGVTLQEIQQQFTVSRRTAERMRDSIMLIIPQVEELPSNSREKRWGFQRGFMNEIINFTPEEIANLEKMKEFQEENGFEDKHKVIDNTLTKIKALSRKNLSKIEDNIEILLQTEGFAVKQTPKYKFDLQMLSTIREAMTKGVKFSAKYNGRDAKISPYGLIYGEKVYLIAVEEEKGSAPFNYLLHKFSDVKLTGETFDKGDFDLEAFAKQSFGVFQGECYDVKLLFNQAVAEDVKNYHFHPTQKIKENEDGTVSVKFKACGSYEILWHLFKWGDSVQILSPKSLKNEYVQMLEKTLKSVK